MFNLKSVRFCEMERGHSFLHRDRWTVAMDVRVVRSLALAQLGFGERRVAALESATAVYRTRGCPLRHRPYRLAYIPPYLPESSRRDWSSDESAAGTDAPCRH